MNNKSIYCGGCQVRICQRYNDWVMIYVEKVIGTLTKVKLQSGKITKLQPDWCYWVHQSNLTIGRQEFSVGDIVKSNLQDSKDAFLGVVTGFEDTGRIVCKSINCIDRVRYAYKPHELVKLPIDGLEEYEQEELQL